MTYDNGPLSLGAFTYLRKHHSDLIYLFAHFVPAVDDNTRFSMVFLKYNNGRFFANAEYAWFNEDFTLPAPLIIGQTVITAPPFHREGYNFFSEAGCVVGPAKFTAMLAQSSRPVLNYNNISKQNVALDINEQVLRPYQWLLFTTYAGGNRAGWGGA